MKHIVKFSGGKDSLATLLVVLATVPREEVLVLFCDTGWEHPDTYTYLTYIEEKLGIEIVRVKSKRFPGGFAQLVAFKRRFPNLAARFCTVALKVEPGIDYILGLQDDVTIYQGIRNDESLARRYMKRNDEYFRFYYEPLRYKGPHDKEIKELEARLLATRAGSADLFLGTQLHDELKRLKQENEANKKPVYHTYRRKEVLAFTDKFSADLIRPIINFTAQETISYIMAHGIKLNPLYYKGAKRVGCYPCAFSSLSEVLIIAENDPWKIDEIDELEVGIGNGATFFEKGKIPEYARKSEWEKKGEVHRVANIRNVIEYAKGDPEQVKMDELRCSNSGCISHYNICEI